MPKDQSAKITPFRVAFSAHHGKRSPVRTPAHELDLLERQGRHANALVTQANQRYAGRRGLGRIQIVLSVENDRNLVALGFNANGITVDDVWQPATTLGVELLQESEGETATGILSLGRVVFLPGPQLVGTVDATLGDTANGGSSGTPADTAVDAPAPEFVDLTTTQTTTTSATPTTPSSTTTQTTTPPSTDNTVPVMNDAPSDASQQ